MLLFKSFLETHRIGLGFQFHRLGRPLTASALMLQELGIYPFSVDQRERFCQGELWRLWAEQYPMLFDADDQQLALGQASMGYHFYEWLAAILLHETSGFHALVGKYQFSKHSRKQEIARTILPEEVQAILHDTATHGRTQGPDLLMFAPDYSAFFFCEVKGPHDTVKPAQRRLFEALAGATGRDIGVLKFRSVPGSVDPPVQHPRISYAPLCYRSPRKG